ncbi:hypothetical protein [Actinacidiphila paucisporea]|uniref:Uncharacterized protein n=1 Tax=Actinacidiphila paucisporea TaxID=310782 RepID=A0A1M7R1X9_9ACTN|nr:hypothetical protein [Actinacidiphila paucisporea]SHN38515.1 hypothetical protein SAMN05216499_1692 [Actinacidiphila paucisporea]
MIVIVAAVILIAAGAAVAVAANGGVERGMGIGILVLGAVLGILGLAMRKRRPTSAS